ncbi:hypothetical protein WJX72_006380 [[Myrmecia] bisecta]|uniref:RecQ-mediated genome instability protein 1 C-terminal OB-fold domain-containing protein n=1 Tax=[Myrmecia] bisecta TaxID=41462 RepID=A0AAW1R7B9_9CHLO
MQTSFADNSTPLRASIGRLPGGGPSERSPMTAESAVSERTEPAGSPPYTCLALAMQRLAGMTDAELPLHFHIMGRVVHSLPPLRFKDPNTGAPTNYSFDLEIEDGSARALAVLAHEFIQELIGLTPSELVAGLQDQPAETRDRLKAASMQMVNYVGPMQMVVHERGASAVVLQLGGRVPLHYSY